jgi:hypothetical protein
VRASVVFPTWRGLTSVTARLRPSARPMAAIRLGRGILRLMLAENTLKILHKIVEFHGLPRIDFLSPWMIVIHGVNDQPPAG